MQNPSSFSIYNASAGSGKTFTLVKAYLKILLQSKSHFQFKNILAITFTNKAVFEMKERIITTLKAFSDPAIIKSNNTMFMLLCKELNMQEEALHSKSKTLLQTIIHNYAAFEISTIDGFTHRIIRTFAHDLKLPLNFEVELDTASLLNKAVDSLIAKAGTDKDFTNTLVDFALEKTDDDKSWDIALDLYKIARLLVNENDIYYLNTLKNKNLNDFKQLKKQIKTDIQSAETAIKEEATSFFNLIELNGIASEDFTRGSVPGFFEKLKQGDFNPSFGLKWQENIASEPLYPKKLVKAKMPVLDGLQPEIVHHFETCKRIVFHLKFLKSIIKNLTQLSVLNAINQELLAIKAEENKMLISEFNTIISNQIKAQPTPFIYERLGEKFNHYFIDEFQDTSTMQWENLIPLISEAIDHFDAEQEPGSLMLVGDAKQAIYRWRGGKAEQFIDLFATDHNPFNTEKQIESLDTNFRSFKEVIQFNNAFFNHLSQKAFTNVNYAELYKKATQNVSNPNEGYVNISFLDTKDQDRNEIYSEEVYNTIQLCLERGYELQDICILVRKTKEAVALANYLSEREVALISSDLLLIKHAPEVLFIINLITLLCQPRNAEVRADVLYFLAEKHNIADKHTFMAQHITLNNAELFNSFSKLDIYTNAESIMQLPLLDLAETLIREFHIVPNSNAYIQYFMDIVLEYSQKQGSDPFGFLEFFSTKIESLSIVSPEGQNAIQIMTIHKSKGLEFPVVIFPFADLDIYRELEPKEWFPLNPEAFNNFEYTLLGYNKDIAEFGDVGQAIHDRHVAELELDNLNLLYVALTRPVEQLYIISNMQLDAKGQHNTKSYSGLFIDFLINKQLWNSSTLSYDFGQPMRRTSEKKDSEHANDQKSIAFTSTAKQDHNIKIIAKSGYLWDTKQQDAIEKGNLVHLLLAKIKTESDVEQVLQDAAQKGLITPIEAPELKGSIDKIINHKELRSYFTTEQTIVTERDILAKDGSILRPDRIVISANNEVTILDYKTGLELETHKQQLNMYQQHIENMNYKVIKKILVYINEDITIVNV